jgi:hypothetical protein
MGLLPVRQRPYWLTEKKQKYRVLTKHALADRQAFRSPYDADLHFFSCIGEKELGGVGRPVPSSTISVQNPKRFRKMLFDPPGM